MRVLLIALVLAFAGCGDAPLLVNPESVAMMGERSAKGPPPCKGWRKSDPGCEEPEPEPAPPPEEPEDPPEEPDPDPPDDPSYDVAIEPGQSIQSAVNANPEGTVFLIRSGVHMRQRIEPKAGNVFVGEEGAVLDGDSVTDHAFFGEVDDVQIRNLEVTGYMPPVQWAAIEAVWDRTNGWLIEDVEVHGNASGGIKIGHDMVIRRAHVHHNGQIGLIGRGHRALIEDSEVSYNNVNGHDPLWEAGGMKFLRSDGIVFRGSHVHHNHGIGIWFDHDNTNSVIEDNVTERNLAGIHYEINGSAVIRNNVVRDNGDGSEDRFSRAGILIYSSRDVEVTGNTLSGNDQGIVGLSDNRIGVYRTENLWVHDNDVTQERGGSGLYDWAGDGQVYGAGNRFDQNTYDVTGNSRPFWHDGGRKSVSGWLATGQDASSEIVP